MKTKVSITKVRAAEIQDTDLADEFRCKVYSINGNTRTKLTQLFFGHIQVNEEGYYFDYRYYVIDWTEAYRYEFEFLDKDINEGVDGDDKIGSVLVDQYQDGSVWLLPHLHAEGPDDEFKFHLTGEGARYWVWFQVEQFEN